MTKFNHYIGGILLVSGTTIGAGMLALPVLTSFVGFVPSILIFIVCWLVMLATAYFFLDVNFAVKEESNLISMTRKMLGFWGGVIAWVFYALLLYSLLAAYIARSSPVFIEAIIDLTGWTMPSWLGPFALPVIFGGFVYIGTFGVDLINRILMFGLVVSFLLLVVCIPSHINSDNFAHVDWASSMIAIPVVITSFGYHIIIPTLTTYLNYDKQHLRLTLLIGSLLPLIIYIIWQVLIIGVVPLEGKGSLVNAWILGTSSTEPLSMIIQQKWISVGAQFFMFFAIVTSFLGISISLSDFFVDGLNIKKNWEGRLCSCFLAFVPPLIFVFTYPRGFIIALQYAGAFVAVLLIFLPALMAWKLKIPKFYQTMRAKLLMVCVMLFAICVVILVLLQQWGFLQFIINRYVQA